MHSVLVRTIDEVDTISTFPKRHDSLQVIVLGDIEVALEVSDASLTCRSRQAPPRVAGRPQ